MNSSDSGSENGEAPIETATAPAETEHTISETETSIFTTDVITETPVSPSETQSDGQTEYPSTITTSQTTIPTDDHPPYPGPLEENDWVHFCEYMILRITGVSDEKTVLYNGYSRKVESFKVFCEPICCGNRQYFNSRNRIKASEWFENYGYFLCQESQNNGLEAGDVILCWLYECRYYDSEKQDNAYALGVGDYIEFTNGVLLTDNERFSKLEAPHLSCISDANLEMALIRKYVHREHKLAFWPEELISRMPEGSIGPGSTLEEAISVMTWFNEYMTAYTDWIVQLEDLYGIAC